jgi:hypothetical protein
MPISARAWAPTRLEHERIGIALARFALAAGLHEVFRAALAHEQNMATLVADEGRDDLDHRSPALIHLSTFGGS